jgi:hypothetical protein
VRIIHIDEDDTVVGAVKVLDREQPEEALLDDESAESADEILDTPASDDEAGDPDDTIH